MMFPGRKKDGTEKSTNLKIMYAINWIAITVFVVGVTWKLIQHLTK